ncbi:MAG: STAS/SEC14 domain-containing protein [Armatimonadetes bacterium]|nr:STAS/SEC14 domain-containing protein [Armatimonadota bacterium]
MRREAQVSSDELLQAVRQLSLSELERFVSEVMTLQAQRKAPSLPQVEAELLLRINQGLPTEVRERYNRLIAKRRSETLTPEEHAELLRLGEQVETLEAQRVERLAELAQLRKTTLPALMQSLGIRTPEYA